MPRAYRKTSSLLNFCANKPRFKKTNLKKVIIGEAIASYLQAAFNLHLELREPIIWSRFLLSLLSVGQMSNTTLEFTEDQLLVVASARSLTRSLFSIRKGQLKMLHPDNGTAVTCDLELLMRSSSDSGRGKDISNLEMVLNLVMFSVWNFFSIFKIE